MKKFFEGFFILGAALLISSGAYADPIRIVVFGDSLTSGYQIQPEEAYPAQLDRKLRDEGFDNFQVINMSRPGETTADALERMSSVIVLHPDIVIVELGSNDVLRGINVSVISNNLGLIISALIQNHAYVVILGTKAPANLGYSYAGQLDAMYKQFSTYYHMPLYPFILEGIWGVPQLNLADGFHPNGRGVGVMVENTYRIVDGALRWEYQIAQQQQYQKQQLQYQQQLQSEGSTTGAPSTFESPQIAKPLGDAPK